MQPSVILEAARDFLAVARRDEAAAEPGAEGAHASAHVSARSAAARGGLVQRVVTVLNMVGARLQALDPQLAATPVFQVLHTTPFPPITNPRS